MKRLALVYALTLALATCLLAPSAVFAQSGKMIDLTDAQMEELVRDSYQYIAMFNVNQKGALDPDNPQITGGYNRIKPKAKNYV